MATHPGMISLCAVPRSPSSPVLFPTCSAGSPQTLRDLSVRVLLLLPICFSEEGNKIFCLVETSRRVEGKLGNPAQLFPDGRQELLMAHSRKGLLALVLPITW